MTHKNYVCVPPPIETLLEECGGQSFWPDKLISQLAISRQIAAQRTLLQRLQKIFAALSLHMTLAEGLAERLVGEPDVEQLCDALATQLERDEVQKRLALYLPFELLSPITTGSASMQRASARLQRAYRLAWERQLLQHEVRANYVDGDVLEPELLVGDYPRVVKAAHLIPDLLQVGHLTVADVRSYYKQSTDALLTSSIYDACVVAADLGLIAQSAFKSAVVSKKPASLPPTDITESRARWLASVAEEQALHEKAEAIAFALERGAHVSELLSEKDLLVAVNAVRIASLWDASVFYQHSKWIEAVSTKSHEPHVHDALTKLYAHLHAHGLIDGGALEKRNMRIPHLSGPFYENRFLLTPSVTEIVAMCSRVATHPRLSQLVYPVALIFGSRVKGYGLTEADCDIAVFVRPGVDRSEREYMEQELLQVYDHERFDGIIKLFWLTEAHERLQVVDWPQHIASDAHSGWMYVLFGALWLGEQESIRLLHDQLLSTYFAAPPTLLEGKPVYERWLEEMERDSLQYRLLHKGFERFYPIQSSVDTEHGSLIDGQSAFYDPQYRRIATLLFVRRVFLPQT